MEEEQDALTAFEKANSIQIDDEIDGVYRFDKAKYEDELIGWEETAKHLPQYFNKARISAIALLKMVMHARSGGRHEVMGILQGKIQGNTMIVMDSFELPVKGTETQVNVGAQEYGFMVNYTEMSAQVGREEHVLGWYHSHPGYGCWLSGIDVATQLLNQQHQDPWLAIVIDPVKTQASGKVELGAFRCFPKGYSATKTDDEYQAIPLDKIEDFGVHASAYVVANIAINGRIDNMTFAPLTYTGNHQHIPLTGLYYQLEVEYFRSSFDTKVLQSLWHQYWNAGYVYQQITDVARKLHAESLKGKRIGRLLGTISDREDSDLKDLERVTKDGIKVSVEMLSGLTGELLKSRVFGQITS